MGRKLKLSRDKKGPSFGFHTWNLDADEQFKAAFAELLKGMIKEGLKLASEKYECSAYFEGDIKTPSLINVTIPLGSGDDNDILGEDPKWSFDLNELLSIEIEMNEMGDGGPIEDSARASFAALRDSLRAMADKLDAALARKPRQHD